MDRATVLEPSEALALIAGGLDHETVGTFAGRPMLVVRVGEDDDARTLLGLTGRLPCVVAGVDDSGSMPRAVEKGFDVLVTSAPEPRPPWVGAADLHHAVAEIATGVDRSPAAAVVLVQLLRLGEQLDARGAILAESLAYGALQAGPEHHAWLSRQPRSPSAAASGDPVIVTRGDDELTITLNRPDVHNAYNSAMRDSLAAALEVVAADPTISSARLTGTGPSFCAGGDLTEFGTRPDPVTGHLVRSTRSAPLLLADCGGRVIAQVHGACIGAGIELAAFASQVVARPDAFFVLPEVGMGLIPGAGGTASIPRRIGRHRTAWMALTGTRVETDRALQWGLVDEVAP